MKKNWPRGLLLGVSLALLLSGGVALAQSLDAWPECFQCRPEAGGDGPYTYNFESCGWYAVEPLHYAETFANGASFDRYPDADGDGCLVSGPLTWPCEEPPYEEESDVTVGNGVWPDDYWGPFEICVSRPNRADQVAAEQIVCDTILFAEVCEVEVDFVPEPGSILLLGSGLAGLAGYATLRWRARE